MTGIFPTLESAHAARRALHSHGVADEHMTVSVSQTEDGIAAEAPGQSYENQPGQPGVRSGRDRAMALYTEAIRGGGCALTVDAASRVEGARLGELMRECGARQVAVPPR